MKKKQKINKAVNYGEWLLLGVTALFLCVLFALREHPAPQRGITVRTASANRAAIPAPVPDGNASPDAAPIPDSVPASGAPANADGVPTPDNAANSNAAPVSDDSAAPESGAASSDGVPAPDTSGLININTASAAELRALPGVGDALAGRIVAYREEHGPFARPEDVMRVSGIGQGKFDAMKGLITV